ncbi:MAG: carboxymuconolactone decarboxylase family protein [Planctomycetota bacterium]
MSRIHLVDPQSATGRASELLTAVEKKLGLIPNMTRGMAVAPAALEAYLAASDALSRGALPGRVREQLALTVAEANGCGYCLAAHSLIGGKLGLSEDEVLAARRAEAPDASTAALLRFARQVAEHRGRVSEADLEAVRAAGYGDDAIAEVIAHVALNVLTNYFNNVAETPIDFPAVPELARA